MSRYSKAIQKINLEAVNNAHTKVIKLVGKNKSVIDFGCSSGYLDEVLRDKFGCKVWGVEIDKEDAKKAERFCEKVLVGDIESYFWQKRIGNKKFDVAIFADVLEHLKDPLGVLKKTKKFLKPKGFVVASIPNIAHLSVRLELLLGQWRYEELGLLDKSHLRFFDFNRAIELFEDAGFYIKKTDFVTGDLPKSIVRNFLRQANLVLTPELEKLLYSKDAQVFQYIVKAGVRKPADYVSPKMKDLPKPIEDWSKFVKEAGALIKQKDQELTSLRSQVSVFQEQLREKDKVLDLGDDKNKRTRELEQELREKERKVNEYFAQLNKIYHSKTWRLLWIYKQIVGFPNRIVQLFKKKKK